MISVLRMTNMVKTGLVLLTCDLTSHPQLAALIAVKLSQLVLLIEVGLVWKFKLAMLIFT